MANISKKAIRRKRREALEKMGYNPEHILGGRLSLQGGGGKSPKNSKYHGGITNQKGAFGGPKWKRGLSAGVYETFTTTNHERCLAMRRRAAALRSHGRIETPFAKEL